MKRLNKEEIGKILNYDYDFLNSLEELDPADVLILTKIADDDIFKEMKPSLLNEQTINILFEEDVSLFRFIPEKQRTNEMCLKAVKSQACLLDFIENQTDEICKAAVEHDGHALKYIKSENMTYPLCLAAVKQNGFAIQHVKDKFLTQELCLAAVKNMGLALMNVPDNLQTEEICIAAVRENWKALKYTAYGSQTNAVCLEAVTICGDALEYVENQTPEICKAAIEEDEDALRFIRNEMYDLEFLKNYSKNEKVKINKSHGIHKKMIRSKLK